MLFSSMMFLWIFLPVLLIGNALLKPKYVNVFLVLASLFFYAWGEPVYVLLMVASVLLNYSAGLLLSRFPVRSKTQKIVLIISVLLNLLMLGVFKYSGMVATFINHVLCFVRLDAFVLPVPQIALPIGISFYTFQALSYVVDVYRQEVKAQKKLLNLALYISFFPQLIAGPIVRYKDVNEQIEHRELTIPQFATGCRRFFYGLAKKVLVSNVMAQGVDRIYALNIPELSCGMAWLAAIMYTLQIYYDFSGYSDMAIGLGKMFGFDFLENFNYPYISRSIQEFWRRWHISLSTWFKEYLYIPLGGNRKGVKRTYLNLLTVFFATGIWHGAGLSFIFWGLYHGFFSIMERLFLSKYLKKSGILSVVYTLLVVIVGWVFFRIEDISSAMQVINVMFTPWQHSTSVYHLFDYVTPQMLIVIPVAAFGAGPMQMLAERKQLLARWRFSFADILTCIVLFVMCVAALTSNTYNPFIYFKF